MWKTQNSPHWRPWARPDQQCDLERVDLRKFVYDYESLLLLQANVLHTHTRRRQLMSQKCQKMLQQHWMMLMVISDIFMNMIYARYNVPTIPLIRYVTTMLLIKATATFAK